MSVGAMKKVARPNDFMYDPLFTVSGAKDHYKAAMMAKISTAKFQICPVFQTMFTDLPHQPRTQLVMRQSSIIPPSYEEMTKAATHKLRPTCKVDIVGSDRHKFFSVPVFQNLSLNIPNIDIRPDTPLKTLRQLSSTAINKRNRKLQTQYRESSAQTSPWEPPYIVMDDSDPEILKLDFLKWGSGLPAGMHEVTLIQRARMKRAWEKVMPPITDAASLEKMRAIIEAMETDEWAFREQEIQDIHDLRLELLEQMLNELHEKSKCRMQKKMKMFCDLKQSEKEEKLTKLRHDAAREMRKLEMHHRGINKKYHLVDIIEEHADRKSELYGPQIRHGEHPKRRHQIIDKHLKKYRAQFRGVEDFSTLPRWLHQATKMKDCCCIKLPGTRLCMRETKWTTPVLKQLHEDLKNLRKVTKRKCNLRVRLQQKEADLETPEVEGITDSEEDVYQAAVFIESILRGRASQVLIYEGRDRCRELIQELRSTHAVLEKERIRIYQERVEVKSQQREEKVCLQNAKCLQEALNRLQGTVIGSLLDFLNKELRRLLDERRAHAMCLLAKRERQNREAAEAGRRQAEIRRRLEHDEMFKQIVKVHQDTVDMYLEDIITEGMEFTSSDDAHNYVVKLAKEIDDEAYETLTKEQPFKEEEELVADLVHNFVLPNVEKQLVRDRMKLMQKKYLRTAHDEIYSKIENLPKPPPPPPKPKKKRTDKNLGVFVPKEFKVSVLEMDSDYNMPSWTDSSAFDFSANDFNLNVIFSQDAQYAPDDADSCVLSIMGPLAGRDSQDSRQRLSQESSFIPLRRKTPDLEMAVMLETPSMTPAPSVQDESIVLKLEDDTSESKENKGPRVRIQENVDID